jgi:hypothetical protein
MMVTKDIWFIAFLELKNYNYVDYKKNKHSNKAEFQYDMTEEQWTELKKEFGKSDISKVKYIQERIKDLIY